jgi:fumarate reductase flavoprotein subunit
MPNKKSSENSEKTANAGISRRGFLQTICGAGALAATPAMALHFLTGNAEAAAVRMLPKKWDEETDVVVVGSGFAGLSAAAEAAARGSNTIIVEKMPIYGGNSRINGGGFNAWTDKLQLRQTLKRGDDSAELHFQDTLKGGDYYNIPELARVLVDNAPAALDWMLNEGGLKLKNVIIRIGGHSAYRDHVTLDGTGRGYIEALKKIAERNGVNKIRLNSKVSWIWRKDPSSPVLGIELETPRGKKNIRIKKALVLTSGGFGRDIKMRQMFNPNITAAYNCTNQPGATGEVIRYAEAIGADALQLCFIQLYPTADPDSGTLDKYALYPSRMPSYGGVFVDFSGKRFVGELERRDVVSRAEINSGGKRAFTVFTEKMIPNVTTQEEVNGGIAAGRVWKANTLAELSKLMDVPGAALENTIAKHNQYLKEGKDPEFGKPFTPQMSAVAEGPFYSVAQWPSVHHCMGGLRINPLAQVIDIWGEPIPRLYAAGEVTGGVHGSNRLGANASPDAVVFGRIAGTNAAKEKE